MVKAEGSTSPIFARLMAGRCGQGSPDGMPPKREPIVSTCRPTAQAMSEAPSTATRKPGTRGAKRRRAMMVASAAAASARVAGSMLPLAAQNASHFSMKPAGTFSMVRPNRSRIWLEKMITAMPEVKPVTTGSGMYLIQVPKRASPATISMAPAIKVASSSPS